MNKLRKSITDIKIDSKNLFVRVGCSNINEESIFLDKLAEILAAGAEVVQIEKNNLSDKDFLSLANKTKQLCAEFGATFIVKSRVDIAYLSEADGVNLEQEDIDIRLAREILGENSIIGIVIYTQAQAVNSVKDGADYISMRISSTPTEPVIETGLEYAKWVSENTFLPVVVEGSIDIAFCQQLIDKNLSKLSVDNTILDTSSPHTVTVNLLEFLKK